MKSKQPLNKTISSVSLIVAVTSVIGMFYIWNLYQQATNSVDNLNQKVANYHALLYSEMETCRTILGCYVDDPSFCATDAYTEKVVELGKKSEEYRARIGEEVTERPTDF